MSTEVAAPKFTINEAGNYVFKWKVQMPCSGCSGAVNRVLTNHEDKKIKSFDVDLASEMVTVEYVPVEGVSAKETYDKLSADIPKTITQSFPPPADA